MSSLKGYRGPIKDMRNGCTRQGSKDMTHETTVGPQPSVAIKRKSGGGEFSSIYSGTSMHAIPAPLVPKGVHASWIRSHDAPSHRCTPQSRAPIVPAAPRATAWPRGTPCLPPRLSTAVRSWDCPRAGPVSRASPLPPCVTLCTVPPLLHRS